MRILLTVLCLTLLSGCASFITGPTRAELTAQDNSACRSSGFRRGTDAYANCMLQQDHYRTSRDDAAVAGYLQSVNTNRPVTCNSSGSATSFGHSAFGSATTTCY